MHENRTALPEALRRQVLVEAGHRCAIPTCRNVPVEIAHIEPWSKVRTHTFENLIALCPTCHARYDGRGDIDRLSMHAYKSRLGMINSRYTQFEMRVLEMFAAENNAGAIDLTFAERFHLHYLIKDGLLSQPHFPDQSRAIIGGQPMGPARYFLTDRGRELVNAWVSAEAVTDPADTPSNF